jgi:hypothetical protein
MRKTSPIALLVLLALAVSFLAFSPAFGAAAHKRGHASTAKNVSSKKSTKAGARAAVTARGRKSPANERISAKAAGGSRRAVLRSSLRPGSKAAMRAHSRIHADLVRRRSRNGRRPAPLPADLMPVHFSIPPPLRGSHESLVNQNVRAEADGLERILDDADLEDRIAHGSLVPLPTTNVLRVNTDLPENRKYCRPWTAKFLTDLSKAHGAMFGGSAIEVTSAVRTVEYQKRLRHINGNAAAADGDIASPHLTGGTIDIGKTGMSAREIGWLRTWLIPLEQAGKIDVEEEFKQSCFHISVYRSYSEAKEVPAHGPGAMPSMLAIHGR